LVTTTNKKANHHETVYYFTYLFHNVSIQCYEDKRRKVALLDCIDALNDKATLTLTGLGRKMRNKHVATKHNIKRVCRLLVMLTYKESEVKYMHLLPASFYRN